jgi:hypothetical protein
VSAGAAIGRWAAYLVLLLAMTLAIACGAEDPPEQARNLAASPTPTVTVSPPPTTTPTATTRRGSLSETICQLNGNCTPTATATLSPSPTRTTTATARTPTATRMPTTTPTPSSFRDFICSFTGNCSPTPTRTAGPVASLPPSPSPGAGITVAQLQRGLVPEEDLGSDWLELDAGVLMREGNQIVIGQYINVVTDESLWVELYDARSGGPEYRALRLITFQGIPEVKAMAPLDYGKGGVRYRYNLVEDGERVYGELAAWQQGPVVVVMQFEGGHADVCLCDLARRQDAWLRDAFR